MTKNATLNGAFAALAVIALFLSLTPAFAFADDEGQTNIITANEGVVTTSVVMAASTGGNTAFGGNSGAAGAGGNVNASEDGNIGGNGGTSGAGGAGGTITTGAVDMSMVVENMLNINDIEVWRGANTDDDVEGDDNITTANAGAATTLGVMAATTGDNFVDGGWSGDAGHAGNVNDSEDENLSGDGGSTGAGGAAGSVSTGAVTSFAGAVNLLNSNLIRVHR